MFKRNSLLVNKKFSEYLLPTILTSMAMSLASVVDGVIVGNLLGSSALAAVGLSGPIILALNGLFFLFAVGGVTAAAEAKGAQNSERANTLFTLCQSAGVLALLLFAALSALFSKQLALIFAQGDAALAETTAEYIAAVVWSGPFLSFSMISSHFWKLDGSPKQAMIISLLANAVNLTLDYVFIELFDAGIAGAGYATLVGYAVGALYSLRYYFAKKRSFRFVLPNQKSFSDIALILDKGAYKMLTALSMMVQNLLLNYLIVLSFGSVGMAVMTVCINIMMIAKIFIGGTSETMLPIVGTLYGEKDISGIRATFKKAGTQLLGVSLFLMVCFCIFTKAVGALFGLADAESLAVLTPALRMFSVYIPLYAASQTLQVLYSCTGHSKLTNVLSLVEGLIFMNGYALLLSYINSYYLWLCYAFSSASIILVTVLYAKTALKKHPELEGITFLPRQKDYIKWESTVNAVTEQATDLSQNILDVCKKNDVSPILANHFAIVVEEMLVNTAQFNKDAEPVTVDVLLCVFSDELLLRFRDDGAPFNPLELKADDALLYERADLAGKLSKAMNYSHQLGFNTTVLSFPRPSDKK